MNTDKMPGEKKKERKCQKDNRNVRTPLLPDSGFQVVTALWH